MVSKWPRSRASATCQSGAGGWISFSPPVESLLSIIVREGAPRSSRSCADVIQNPLRRTGVASPSERCQTPASHSRKTHVTACAGFLSLHSASFSSWRFARQSNSTCCSLRRFSLSAGSLDSLSCFFFLFSL